MHMQLYISKLTIICSDNGLVPGQCQTIIWTNAGMLLIRNLGTNFSEIPSKRSYIFSCDQAAISLVQSVCLSVRPSVRPSVPPSHLFTPQPSGLEGYCRHGWGRAGGCQNCGTHISVTAWWIFSLRSSMELSRPVVVHCHAHLPICPIWACPWAKN